MAEKRQANHLIKVLHLSSL